VDIFGAREMRFRNGGSAGIATMTTAAQPVPTLQCQQGSRMHERHYSPSELGELWNLSSDTIRRAFENESGVLVFENPTRSSDRRFRTLRIPESVALRVYARLTNCRIERKG
jgi:hypothetical protein